MQTALPVALSAQIAQQHRLDALADNVANAASPGFLATKLRFAEAVERHGGPSIAFVRTGETHLSHARGSLTRTDAPLDFAVRGEAWLAIDTPDGRVLTRDGRTQLLASGQLVTLEGHAVLDPGGAPVILDPALGAPIAGADGSLLQDGRPVASIGLFEVDRPPARRWGNSGVISDAPPRPVIGRTDVSLVQGFVEGANVNPVEQMVRLIEVSRSFETLNGLVTRADSTLADSLRTLAAQ